MAGNDDNYHRRRSSIKRPNSHHNSRSGDRRRRRDDERMKDCADGRRRSRSSSRGRECRRRSDSKNDGRRRRSRSRGGRGSNERKRETRHDSRNQERSSRRSRSPRNRKEKVEQRRPSLDRNNRDKRDQNGDGCESNTHKQDRRSENKKRNLSPKAGRVKRSRWGPSSSEGDNDDNKEESVPERGVEQSLEDATRLNRNQTTERTTRKPSGIKIHPTVFPMEKLTSRRLIFNEVDVPNVDVSVKEASAIQGLPDLPAISKDSKSQDNQNQPMGNEQEKPGKSIVDQRATDRGRKGTNPDIVETPDFEYSPVREPSVVPSKSSQNSPASGAPHEEPLMENYISDDQFDNDSGLDSDAQDTNYEVDNENNDNSSISPNNAANNSVLKQFDEKLMGLLNNYEISSAKQEKETKITNSTTSEAASPSQTLSDNENGFSGASPPITQDENYNDILPDLTPTNDEKHFVYSSEATETGVKIRSAAVQDNDQNSGEENEDVQKHSTPQEEVEFSTNGEDEEIVAQTTENLKRTISNLRFEIKWLKVDKEELTTRVEWRDKAVKGLLVNIRVDRERREREMERLKEQLQEHRKTIDELNERISSMVKKRLADMEKKKEARVQLKKVIDSLEGEEE